MKLIDLIQLLENNVDTWTEKLVGLIKNLSELVFYLS